MTFTTTASNWTNASSDANFRAWGSYISDQLTAVGLLKTADTGQVDWTTVLNPGAINTYNAYEVRAFSDALQATAPVFFKIFYGEGTGTDNPAIGISFGTGSDGAGNLTGTTSTLMRDAAAAAAGSTVVVGSGANNRFVLNTNQNSGMLFGFERTKDSLGNDTSEGIVYFVNGSGNFGSTSAGSSSARSLYWNPITGTIVDSATNSSLAALFPWQTSFVYGAQTGVAPVFPEKPIFGNPVLGIVGYYTGDITPTNTFVAYMYGTAHQYYACVAVSSAQSSAWRGSSGGIESAAIRYE